MQIVALFGPTGVGKTAVALALARRLRARGENPVAVSADALQVYRDMEILTGVASAHERAELEHRLVSFLSPRERFSAGRYAKLAHAEIDELLERGARPIVVGGTGLYLRAALTELDMKPPPARGARERWRALLESKGAPALHATLAERAPAVARGLNPNDRQRVMRALELAEAGELQALDGESQLWSEDTRRPTLLIGLTLEREALYERIDARVQAMLEAGVREEVERVEAAGASETARKALGFEELLAGDVEAMKRHTRNYARRQLSWMRKLAEVRVIDVTGRDANDVAKEIVEALDRTSLHGG
jgi:tRNA dimethylallyltransferase